MKRRQRLFILALVLLPAALLVLLLLPRPDRTAPEEEELFLVGLSQANLVEPWRVAMNLEFEEAAAEHPQLRVIYTDAAQDARRQIADVEMLMGYGIDLLVISPNEGEELAETIARVYEKIPVIVLDREPEGDDFTLFLAADNEEAGYRAGQMLAQLLHGSGSVVEIVGTEGAPPMVERAAGFARALEEYPGIVVSERLQANWLQDQAQDRMKEYILIENELPDAVVAQSDDMACGAGIALENLLLSRPVFLLGMGGSDSAELLSRGVLDGSVVCPSCGREAVEWALRLREGEVPENKRILLPPRVLTQESMSASGEQKEP